MRRLCALLLPISCTISVQLHAQAPVVVYNPDTTPAATIEAMKSQLRKMAEAQKLHFSRHKKYATNLAPTRRDQLTLYTIQITSATAGGWVAVGTAASDTTLHCGIYEGTASSPNAAVTRPRTPECWGGARP